MHPSSAQIIPLYERHAAAFDRLRLKNGIERVWLDRLRALAGLGATVLDLGCGSGEPIARYLIAHGHAVTGVDAADAMLVFCRQRFPEQTWIQADMRMLALGRRFGGLVAWDSFFHLPAADQRAMFGIFAAHALPGAALLFTSGPQAGEAIGQFEGETLYHASLDPEEYRALLAGAGFSLVDHIADDPACGGRTVWLARYTT